MNDDVVQLISIFGVLVLVGSALLHRGLSQRGAIKLALIWMAIILATWAAVALIQHAQTFFAGNA